MSGWADIDMPWIENEGLMDFLIEKANILDILDEFDIEYIETSSGEFSHKLRCPFHADGDERTPSMFVCLAKNSFYCFGCNSGGSIINLVAKHLGIPFYEAIKWLSEFIGLDQNTEITWTKKERRDPHETILFQVFEIGALIREQLKKKENADNYNKWIVWANERYKKLDYFLDSIKDEEWEIVSKYKDKVKIFIERNE